MSILTYYTPRILDFVISAVNILSERYKFALFVIMLSKLCTENFTTWFLKEHIQNTFTTHSIVFINNLK
jgi:hypothetical protein